MENETRLHADTHLGTITHANSNNNPEGDLQPPTFDSDFKNEFNQKIDEAIELIFNEPVKAGTGNIILSNGSDTRIIDINDSQQVSFETSRASFSKVNYLGNVFIKPADDLISGTRYSIQIADSAIRDTVGNAFTGINDTNAVSFTTTPSNPLMFYTNVSSSPIKADQSIKILFDEAVMTGSGNIVISNGIDRHVINAEDTNQVSFSYDGRWITINPFADLMPDSQYMLWMTYGAITDLTGNIFKAVNFFQPIDFKTTTSAPFLEHTNAVGEVKADRNFVLNFDEAVIAGTGNITISNGIDTRTINVNDNSQVNFDTTGSVVINPVDDLLSGSLYTIHIPSGAITDTKNNAYIGTDLSNTISFIATLPNPQFLGSKPWDEWTEFHIDEKIDLFFDEAVMPGNGTITVTNGTDIRTISAHDTSQITFNDSSILIDPFMDLQPHTRYSVLISDNAILDTGDRPFAGITNPETLNFTTIPTEPALRLNEPLGKIKTDAAITFNFNENILPGNGTIIITNGKDTRVINVHDSNQIAFFSNGLTIHPNENLIAGTTYHIQMPAGIVTDANGNASIGVNDPEKLSFTTIAPNPLLTRFNSSDFAFTEATLLKVDSNFVLRFDEPILPGNGTIVISNEMDTRIIDIRDTSQIAFDYNSVTINPIADLIPDTRYSIRISDRAIIDTEDNGYISINDTERLTFTTTASNPLLIDSFPEDDSSDSITKWGIDLVFDEITTPGNGTVTIRSEMDSRIIDIHDTQQISFFDDTVTINPLSDLLPNTHYSIQITPGAITDVAGNPYAGIGDLTTLDFTTSDFVQTHEFL